MSIPASAHLKQIEVKLCKNYKSSEANEARLKNYLDKKLEAGRNFINKRK
jgi:hypothetical protein